MDSGMAAYLQTERGTALDQATGGVIGETAGGNASSSAWPRVRATGFGEDIPPPLLDALRACVAPGARIEWAEMASAGGAAPTSVDLHLVAFAGPDAAVDGPGPLANGEGRCLAVCIDADQRTVLRAIAAGVDGVLCLHDGHDDLTKALRAAVSGAPALTATAARALIAHARATAIRQAPEGSASADPANQSPVADASAPPPPAIRLTAREREIIMLADQGCTFTQAARLLGVQVSTVYTHVRRLYEKLSVNSLPQALHEARRAGLL